MTVSWQLAGRRELLFHAWDDELTAVCYDTGSGDTHLVDLVTSRALVALQNSPHAMSLDAIASNVSASLDIEANETLVHQIEQSLSQFSQLGVLARN